MQKTYAILLLALAGLSGCGNLLGLPDPPDTASYQQYSCEDLFQIRKFNSNINNPGVDWDGSVRGAELAYSQKGCPSQALTENSLTASHGAGSQGDARSAQHGWLGVFMDDGALPPAIARSLGLKEAKGILTIGVWPRSAAELAGLKAGDVVQSIDGHTFDLGSTARAFLATQPAGKTIKLIVWRNHTSVTLSPTLTAVSAEPDPLPNGFEFYCYAVVLPDSPLPTGTVTWVSSLWALPGANVSNAFELGNIKGEQFRQYLLSQGVAPAAASKGQGVCAQGASYASDNLKRRLDAGRTPESLSSGSAIGYLFWEP